MLFKYRTYLSNKELFLLFEYFRNLNPYNRLTLQNQFYHAVVEMIRYSTGS